MVDQSLRLDPNDKVTAGVANYRLGLIAYKTGDISGAERLLRLARNDWQVDRVPDEIPPASGAFNSTGNLLPWHLTGHPLDSDAACLLGKIRQQLGDPRRGRGIFPIRAGERSGIAHRRRLYAGPRASPASPWARMMRDSPT